MSSKRNHLRNLLLLVVALGFVTGLCIFLRARAPREAAAPPAETLRHDLVQTDGYWYRSGETNPFTGWMVDYYPDGARLSRSQISNGILNGVCETFYTNSQMQMRENFKQGISDGLREKWHANGVKLSRATIAAGKIMGTFQSWHDNGQLSEQIELKSGQPDGVAWAYYPSGFLKAETKITEGQVRERKSWQDGERKNP